MSLTDLVDEAVRMSRTLTETRRGYAFLATPQGRLRVMHDRAAESGRGITRYALNSIPIRRERAQILADAAS